MIKEQKLKFIGNNNDILQKIRLKGKYLEQNDNIEIEYYGDKSLLEIELDDDNKNNYLIGKYKNIYIGGLSIFNPSLREKFGLNKYFNKLTFLILNI